MSSQYFGDRGGFVATSIGQKILDVPDYPKPGIIFKDLSPVFADGALLYQVAANIAERFNGDYEGEFDVVAGIEARGFMVATAVAYYAGLGVVPIRKAGKLPRETYSESYDLEYGSATLEVHKDAFELGDRVLLVDDVLATGGTALAACNLIEKAEGSVVGVSFVLELSFLSGRVKLEDEGYNVHSLVIS